MSIKKATIIFDNAGGVLLKLGGTWAHYYQDATQAAEDYVEYLSTGTTECWDGHEPELLDFEPAAEEIRNGGYRVFDQWTIALAAAEPDFETSWYNVRDFVDILRNANIGILAGIRRVAEGNTDFDIGFDVLFRFMAENPNSATTRGFIEYHEGEMNSPRLPTGEANFTYLIGREFVPDQWVDEEDMPAFMRRYRQATEE